MKIFAHIVSIVFHPIFIIVYGLALQITLNPYAFAVSDPKQSVLLWVSVVSMTVVFPLITVLMLRALGMITSLQMHDRQERIGPLVCTGLFYLWLFINIKNYSIVPKQFVIFVLGSVISLFLAFFINNFTKISLHTTAVGGLLAMALIGQFAFNYPSFDINFFGYGVYRFSTRVMLMAVLLVAGMVGTSRLVLNAHGPQEIYGGYVIGIFGQLIALRFLI